MSLADPKIKKDSFFDNIKNVGKRMTFADKAFMFLTAANYAMNPRGAKGIRDVIQHNQDESRKLATANARAALSRVNSSVLPAIRQNETWMKDTANYVTNELQGVDPVFISALIKANKLDEFKAMTQKINDARALKGQPKLTKQDYELMMPSFRKQLSAYTNIDGFENTPESVSKALRKYYAGYDKLLKNAKTPNQLNAGIFASSYGSPLAGMQLANDYLRGAGQTQIGDETVTYDRLSELPIGSIGFDQDQLEPVEGGLDYSKGMPSMLGEKITDVLNDRLNDFVGIVETNAKATLSNTINGRVVSSFANIYDSEADDFGRMWSGDPEELRESKKGLIQKLRRAKEQLASATSEARKNQLNAEIVILEQQVEKHRQMVNMSVGGRGIYQLLHREAYVKTYLSIQARDPQDFISALGEKMKEMKIYADQNPRVSGQKRTLTGYMAMFGIDQNYVFSDRHSLKIFIDLMGGTDGGILSSGTVLQYRTYDGTPEEIRVEDVLRRPEFMGQAKWDLD